MPFKNPAKFLLTIFLCSCAPMKELDSPSQLDIEVKSSGQVPMDSDSKRESEGLHNYLVGQLYYGEEDFGKALDYFSKASDIVDDPTPVLHTRLAQLYVREGKLNEALSEIEKALKVEPRSSFNLLMYAGILESLGRAKEAEPVYVEVIDEFPDTSDAYILLSSLYVKSGDYEKGITFLRRLVQRMPSQIMGYRYLARAYEEQGNLSEAKQTLLKAHGLPNSNSSVTLDLVRVLLRSEEFAEAKSYTAKILEKEPDNQLARRIMSHLMIGENKYDEALKHLMVLESLELDPTDTRFKIALIQIDRQNFAEAIRELNLVLVQKPDHDQARYYLASVYAGLGRSNEAVEDLLKLKPQSEMYLKARMLAGFILRQEGKADAAQDIIKEALDNDPNNLDLATYYISLLREAKKYDKAEKYLSKAIKLHPSEEKLYFSYSIVLSDLKQTKAALVAMEKVLEINPQNSDALNYIAYAQTEADGDLVRALALIKRALEIKPNDGYYLDTLGWIHYNSGHYELAEKTLALAVTIVGNDPVIIEHYADALMRVNNTDKAIENYQLALEKAKDDMSLEEQKEIILRIEKKVLELGSIQESSSNNSKK